MSENGVPLIRSKEGSGSSDENMSRPDGRSVKKGSEGS